MYNTFFYVKHWGHCGPKLFYLFFRTDSNSHILQVMVQYDGTVRNAVGQVIQFRYGEDGLAGEFVEGQQLRTIQLANVPFERKYKFDPTNERYVRRLFTDEILREMVGSSEVVAAIEGEWEQLQRDRDTLRQIFPTGNNKVHLPCNLERMIWNAQKTFHINKR